VVWWLGRFIWGEWGEPERERERVCGVRWGEGFADVVTGG
jgi:hypothetical protein